MSVIVLILILSLCIASVFLASFIWSVKNGQYEDEISSSQRILFDNKKKNQS
jgi:cbb3-type cytochrome oxidase maturation protein